jgi:Fe-Mn family superoxide dismutase
MQPTNRRKFITSTAKASIATVIAANAFSNAVASEFNGNKHIPYNFTYKQTPLAYSYAALEPFIDAITMDIHFNKHAAAYCKNVQEALVAEKVDTAVGIEKLLATISTYSTKMRNNAGGHYNHELFWKCLAPPVSNTQPSPALTNAINKQFGSIDVMKKQFGEAAKTRFGSGWAWLIIKADKSLAICSTPNQDNPLMDIADTKGTPLFALDVWEHAYYLKYQNRRVEYIENFWKILNWQFINDQFAAI